jgi:hypothetical protein
MRVGVAGAVDDREYRMVPTAEVEVLTGQVVLPEVTEAPGLTAVPLREVLR